ISFNEVDKSHRFLGLRKLDLKADPQDLPVLRNRIAGNYMLRLGIPGIGFCASSARLNINGQYYGVYQSVEHVDGDYLARNFPNPNGNLYKFGYIRQNNLTHPDRSDIDMWHASTDPSVLQAFSNLDQIVTAWASEAVLPQGD